MFAVKNAMVDLIASAQRRPAISRRRLNEDTLERRVQQELSVHHRVVSDAACEAQIRQPSLLVQMIQNMEANLFEPKLQARGDVVFASCQSSARRAWWAKPLSKFVRIDATDNGRALVPGHLDSFGMMAEVVEVQTKSSILFSADDVAKLTDEPRLPVGRKTHHLSFIAVMGKTEKLRCRSVDNSG